MPALHRQAAPEALDDRDGLAGRAGVRRVDRVPETAPTPLQRHYITLSAPALVAGFVAITALEVGVPLGSLVVKACVLIAAPLLLVANGDAALRIWRSAWAWMPVDRGRGLFRLGWVAAAAIGLLLITAGALVVLLA